MKTFELIDEYCEENFTDFKMSYYWLSGDEFPLLHIMSDKHEEKEIDLLDYITWLYAKRR